MRTALVVYLPVLHRGYLDLIGGADASALYVISDDLLVELSEEFDYLRRKDSIRALPDIKMLAALRGLLAPGTPLGIADNTGCEKIAAHYDQVIMPDEDVSRAVAQRYFSSIRVEFVSIFLRWDRDAVIKEESASLKAHRSIHVSELDRLFMNRAQQEAEKSADWWRQVGAVLVKGDTVIFAARNDHTPSPQTPYAFGDPRSIFKRGVRIECSTAEHAEAALIAEAAKRGVSTEGASLYATMFPCPQCARLIAHAGVKRCYFANGYAVLDGARVMTGQGVELIFVDNEAPRN